jgi:ABC-2 family transporter
MSGSLSYARTEWLVALRRPRPFALSALVPAGTVAALLFGGAPAPHASVVVVVLFSFFGTFGSAIPLVRDLETGRLTRLLQAGANPAKLLSQRLFVSAAIDFLQLVPTLGILLLIGTPTASLPLVGSLFLALLFANMLGTWIGALTRSIGEAALLCSVTVLFLLHAAGVFRTPVPDTLSASLAAWSPFAPLRATVRRAWGSDPNAPLNVSGPLVVIVFMLIATLLLLPRSARDFRVARR